MYDNSIVESCRKKLETTEDAFFVNGKPHRAIAENWRDYI